MNDETIIHLLMYLQNMIDSGQHKLFYNDLMHDEKVIDIINAITNLQQEKEDYKSRCEKAIEYIKSPKICIDIRKTNGTLDFVSTDELENILNGDE